MNRAICYPTDSLFTPYQFLSRAHLYFTICYEIANALFAYVVQVSLDAGFDGVLVFKAKTSDLLDYYAREFGARQVAAYDPFRMVIGEDAAERTISEFRRDSNG